MAMPTHTVFLSGCMTTLNDIESVLETYSFSEVLELNNLTEEDALLFLVNEELVELPDVKPLDLS